MAGPWQGTMFFHAGIQGWSETWYKQSGSAEDVLTSLRAVADARLPMLSAQAFLVALRVSDTTIRGDAHYKNFLNKSYIDKDAAGRPSDYPTQGWYTRWQTSEGNRRQLFLRGQPDTAFELGSNLGDFAEAEPPAYLLEAFKKYVAAVKAQTWGIFSNTFDATNPEKFVSNVSLVNPGTDAHFKLRVIGSTFAVNQQIVPYRLSKQYPELSGPQRILAVAEVAGPPAAQDLTLYRLSGVSPIPAYDNDGAVRAYSRQVRVPSKAEFMRMGKRDIGSPFGRTRGRARARR